MYYLAINRVKPDADPRSIGPLIADHIAWVRREISRGTVVQAGKWGLAGGMCIVKARAEQDARELLQNDPFYRSGLFLFELAEFHPDVEVEAVDVKRGEAS